MLRFLSIAFTLLCMAFVHPAQAEMVNSPPLTGDMVKLKLYEHPEKLPEVIFTSAKEEQVYLSSFKGNIVILNIWATWCPPCVKELPSLNKLQGSIDGKVKVVAVSLDNTGMFAPTQFMKDNHLDNLKPYIDPNESLQALPVLHDVAGIPVTLIIDPQMRVLARYEGDTDWDSPAVRAVLDYYKKNASFSIINLDNMPF